MPDGSARLGELLALGSALCWGTAIIFFRLSGKKVAPLGLNLFKNVLGLVLFLVTMALAGEPVVRSASARDYALLLASGLVGIALSDTLFFVSINLLGAGRAAVIASLYSPFTIILSIAYLAERLSMRQVAGVLLVFAAVVIISRDRKETNARPAALAKGIFLGVLAQLATAAGIVMIKPLLARSPVLWATSFRLAAAIPVLALVLALQPGRRAAWSSLVSVKNWTTLVPASFLGTYLGLIAWMGSMKYAPASVAAALSQTSTAFTFILATLFLKERATAAKAAAVVMALAGAFLISSL